MRLTLTAAACLALGACATQPPISANPVQDVTQAAAANSLPLVGTVQQGLLDAEFNLDNAIVVGALPKTDPADACLHGALTQIGIEPQANGTPATPLPSFTPKVSDLISAGSVLYIRAQQLKALQGAGGLTVPVPCEAIIGQFVLDAGKAGAGALPGGNIITSILPKT